MNKLKARREENAQLRRVLAEQVLKELNAKMVSAPKTPIIIRKAKLVRIF